MSDAARPPMVKDSADAPAGAASIADEVVADVAAGFAPIAIDALSKRYGDFLAVDALSLRVHRGEVFGFLGRGVERSHGEVRPPRPFALSAASDQASARRPSPS
jgi:hypothetical protein